MSTEIGTVGSRSPASSRAWSRKMRVPGLPSGVKDSSLATEWVSTDAWLRPAFTVRSTVTSARWRSFGRQRMCFLLSRCQIGASFHTMIPARSNRESSRSFMR